MESRYLPAEYSGRKVGLEERMGGLIVGSILIVSSPLYLVAEGIERVRRGKESPLKEWADTFKICYGVTIQGRFPQRAEED